MARAPSLTLRHEAEEAAARFPALMAEAERIAATIVQGAHGRRRKGQGETFWEYRRFAQTDPTSRIDWRRSARSSDLYVRENEWESAQAIWLWRDGRQGMAWRSDKTLPAKRDRAAVILMAAAALLSRGGERIGALGEARLARAGATGLDRTARRLAEGPGDIEAVETAAARPHARLVLASDFLDEPDVWAARLARLDALPARGVLLCVADPAEASFPYSGRTVFRGAASAKEILVGRAETARDTYQRRYRAQRHAIGDIARRLGWPMVTHVTDQPPAQALLALYRALSPER